MKGKKKKKTRLNLDTLPPKINHFYELLSPSKPMNDARYRPVKLLTLKKNILRVG